MNLIETIISDQNEQIKNRLFILNCDNEFLLNKLNQLKNINTSSFSDSLANSFYGGKVGFMGKNGAKKLSSELDKTIEKYNTISKIESKIKSNECVISALNKGKIQSKNGLLDWTYEKMLSIVCSYENAYQSKKIKEKELTTEELSIVKENLKLYKSKIKKTEKKYA